MRPLLHRRAGRLTLHEATAGETPDANEGRDDDRRATFEGENLTPHLTPTPMEAGGIGEKRVGNPRG
jgi:hypothetical protein